MVILLQPVVNQWKNSLCGVKPKLRILSGLEGAVEEHRVGVLDTGFIYLAV